MGGYLVHGREHIPRTGGAVICSNHVSFLDPPVLGSGLPRRTYFMAKKELFEVPVLGPMIRSVYAFPVDRDTTDREAIRHGIELLEKGELLVVFPEGGRSPDGSLQPGNIGPALMAGRAGVPIIPAALKGTNQIMPREGKGLHRGRVQVDYGAPIHPRQFGEGRLDKHQLQAFTEAVMEAIAALQRTQYERVGEVAPPRVKEHPDAE
jgi:1-acyl-sn-glycerol-3-phosphate acyltransferase